MLRSFFYIITLLGLLSSATAGMAQHSDVEFGYDDLVQPTAFVIEGETTFEGFQFFEAEMFEFDPFEPGNFGTDEPGFATNHLEDLLVNPDDRIWINVRDAAVDSAVGVGYVNYFNPSTNQLEAIGRIRVEDNSGGTAHLVLNGLAIESGVNPQFLAIADGKGDVHDHVFFDLLDDADAPLGAYGVLIQLQADFAPADGKVDLESGLFWFIFNHGMSEEDFDEQALPAFGVGEFGPICAATGQLIEGVGEINDFSAVCGSDDSYWAAHGATLFFQISDPVVQFEMTAIAPAGFDVGAISVDVEASKQSNLANLNLRASLYNFSTDSYVSLPGVMPLATVDTVTNFELPVTADPADFVEPNTGEIRLLLQTIQTSGLPNVRTQLDEVLFHIE